jgi:hypothetical protein
LKAYINKSRQQLLVMHVSQEDIKMKKPKASVMTASRVNIKMLAERLFVSIVRKVLL